MMPFSRARRGALALAVGLAAVVAPVVTATSSQATLAVCRTGQQPVVRTIAPGQNLKYAISSQCPGDTLELLPGTYNVGLLAFYTDTPGPMGIMRGTATRPITITAADPANPPLIVGALQFSGANYWRLLSLRVQATVANRAALYMKNGTGWSVRSCEFFGARQTNSMANVVISGSGGTPRGFEFRGNLVHDAALSGRADTTDHNLYVNFQGAPGSGGIITRNVIWNAPHGAGIKLGNGGTYNALGPWGVTVAMNTIYNSGRAILLHGNIRNNAVWGNLMVLATQHFAANPMTTQIYAHDVTGSGNAFSHNYSFASTMFMYDPRRSVHLGANVQVNSASGNPLLHTGSVGVLVPLNAAARPYGASGTMRW